VSLELGDHADLRVTTVTPRASNSTSSGPGSGVIEWTVKNFGSVAPSVTIGRPNVFSTQATFGRFRRYRIGNRCTLQHSRINESYVQAATVLRFPRTQWQLQSVRHHRCEQPGPRGRAKNNNVSTPTVFSIDRRQPDLLVTSVWFRLDS